MCWSKLPDERSLGLRILPTLERRKKKHKTLLSRAAERQPRPRGTKSPHKNEEARLDQNYVERAFTAGENASRRRAPRRDWPTDERAHLCRFLVEEVLGRPALVLVARVCSFPVATGLLLLPGSILRVGSGRAGKTKGKT